MSFLDNDGVTKLVATLKRRFASKEEVQFVEAAKQDVLVSGSNIVTINGKTLLRLGDFSINELPNVFSADNGKVLRVVNGAWAAAQLPSASGVNF